MMKKEIMWHGVTLQQDVCCSEMLGWWGDDESQFGQSSEVGEWIWYNFCMQESLRVDCCWKACWRRNSKVTLILLQNSHSHMTQSHNWLTQRLQQTAIGVVPLMRWDSCALLHIVLCLEYYQIIQQTIPSGIRIYLSDSDEVVHNHKSIILTCNCMQH